MGNISSSRDKFDGRAVGLSVVAGCSRTWLPFEELCFDSASSSSKIERNSASASSSRVGVCLSGLMGLFGTASKEEDGTLCGGEHAGGDVWGVEASTGVDCQPQNQPIWSLDSSAATRNYGSFSNQTVKETASSRLT